MTIETKYSIGDKVVLITDLEKQLRIVTGITVRGAEHSYHIYELSGVSGVGHFIEQEFETYDAESNKGGVVGYFKNKLGPRN